jgi:hypothetical protein
VFGRSALATTQAGAPHLPAEAAGLSTREVAGEWERRRRSCTDYLTRPITRSQHARAGNGRSRRSRKKTKPAVARLLTVVDPLSPLFDQSSSCPINARERPTEVSTSGAIASRPRDLLDWRSVDGNVTDFWTLIAVPRR